MTAPLQTPDEVAAVTGWPRLKLEREDLPVVYLYPVGAPHPGTPFVRIRPVAALGMDPQHPHVYIDGRDPLAHLVERTHDD